MSEKETKSGTKRLLSAFISIEAYDKLKEKAAKDQRTVTALARIILENAAHSKKARA